jgi:hypothetical protein
MLYPGSFATAAVFVGGPSGPMLSAQFAARTQIRDTQPDPAHL